MKKALLRNVSLFASRCLLSSTKSDGFNSIPKQPLLPALIPLQLRFYSAKENIDDVSSEELKKRIQKYYDGDADAIPSIFEAILKRKLSGKHDESDDELMNEIRGGQPLGDIKEQEFDTDSSGEFDTDED